MRQNNAGWRSCLMRVVQKRFTVCGIAKRRSTNYAATALTIQQRWFLNKIGIAASSNIHICQFVSAAHHLLMRSISLNSTKNPTPCLLRKIALRTGFDASSRHQYPATQKYVKNLYTPVFQDDRTRLQFFPHENICKEFPYKCHRLW